jgi:hypothetical protein
MSFYIHPPALPPDAPHGHRCKLVTQLPRAQYLLSYDADSIRVYEVIRKRPVIHTGCRRSG